MCQTARPPSRLPQREVETQRISRPQANRGSACARLSPTTGPGSERTLRVPAGRLHGTVAGYNPRAATPVGKLAAPPRDEQSRLGLAVWEMPTTDLYPWPDPHIAEKSRRPKTQCVVRLCMPR